MSDQNVREARAAVAGFIAELQTEQADYGGHRVDAISRLQAAENELTSGLQARDANMPGQRMSDIVLRQVRDRARNIVAQLTNDQADYGGHRVNAINELNAAVNALNAALATR
ncbi:MAG: hypothetical protein JO060_00970 [Candidatus Eremiobacteraeota bacterium]|nr:hypothetical protein [Candidatus Eremiobacteraeota bacterium]